MKKTLRVSLGTEDHKQAIIRRDILLGQLQEMRQELQGQVRWSERRALGLGRSIQQRELLVTTDEGPDPELALDLIREEAEEMAESKGPKEAHRWFMLASGQGTPLQDIAERYIEHRRADMKTASINDLRTETKRFWEWADGQPEGALFQSVTRAMAYRYVCEHLSNVRVRGGKVVDCPH